MNKQAIVERISVLTNRLNEIKDESKVRANELRTSSSIIDSFQYKEVITLKEKLLLAVVMYKIDLIIKEAEKTDIELDNINNELDVLHYMLILAKR